MTNKIRVMQVLYSGLGGHGSVFMSFIEGDEKRKAEHSALFFGIEQTKPEYLSFCKQHGVSAYSVKKIQGIDLTSWKEVYAVFNLEKPDVIILHSLNLLAVAYTYQLLNKAKVIVVEHTPLDVKTKAEWLFSGLAMRFSPQIVLLHNDYARELKSRLGAFYSTGKISIIGNGVNTSKYKPEKKIAARNGLVISMISRFSQFKDHKTLILAFRILLDKISAVTPIKLHLAGSGETLEEMQQLVSEKGLQESVVFPGLLSEEEIIPFLQNTDIYVHSSLGETMCTAVMQAMAVGLPVIGSDIMGINNLIEKNVSGLLFSPEDPDDLAERLLFLLQNPEKRNKLGVNARKYAVEHFSHTEMFNKYASLFFSDEPQNKSESK